MFNYEEFIAKATLYFERAATADVDSEERATWLLLGLEFILRAPLANVHPTLLALPEGDSILHAAGIAQARGVPRSLPTKSVIERLTRIDPNFGEDRGKDAAFLTELRNEELHSSRATFVGIDPVTWMPKFLAVAEAVCSHLGMDLDSLLDQDVIQECEAYRSTADAKIQGLVRQLSKNASTVFTALTAAEISARAALPSPVPGAAPIECPVCKQRSAWLTLSRGRTTDPKYDEGQEEIQYDLIQVATALQCTVCDLSLSTTAQVLASGIPRLHITEVTEDRYSGWENLITYDDAMNFLGSGEDYGNE